MELDGRGAEAAGEEGGKSGELGGGETPTAAHKSARGHGVGEAGSGGGASAIFKSGASGGLAPPAKASEWLVRTSKSGRTLYYNTETKKSLWDLPGE